MTQSVMPASGEVIAAIARRRRGLYWITMARQEPAKNLMGGELELLSWSEQDLAGSLQKVFEHVQGKALETIAWYMSRKRLRAWLSQALRLGAIFFVTVGGLVPLLSATRVIPATLSTDMGQVGYVSFALAGGCVALDRFFGLSSSWMRYITTSFAIQRLLAEFQLEWAVLQVKVAGRQPTRAQAEQMLLRLKAFRSEVLELVERETQSWVSEFQTNLAELYRVSRSRAEATEPGVLEVVVTNGKEAKGDITVLVDNVEREHFQGTRTLIPGVAPGHHVVLVRATINDVSVDVSGTVMVSPGAVGSISVALPIPPGKAASQPAAPAAQGGA